MFCSYCGKQTDYEGKLCKECEAAFQNAQSGDNTAYGDQGYYPPEFDRYFYTSEPEPYNVMFGFGKALASTVMGTVGFVFVYIALGLALFSGGAGFLLTAVVLGLSIPALVFGIQSVKCFMRRKATCAKNIPALVLGINGIWQAGFALSGAFLSLLISLVNL